MYDSEGWHLAIHEAGHAVVAELRGRRIESVEILEGATADVIRGRCFYAPLSDADAVVSLAGPAAQAHAMAAHPDRAAEVLRSMGSEPSPTDPEFLLSVMFHGGRGDFAEAEALVEEGVDDAFGEACSIVADHWSTIERVALALVTWKRLHASTVHLLIQSAATCGNCHLSLEVGEPLHRGGRCVSILSEGTASLAAKGELLGIIRRGDAGREA